MHTWLNRGDKMLIVYDFPNIKMNAVYSAIVFLDLFKRKKYIAYRKHESDQDKLKNNQLVINN